MKQTITTFLASILCIAAFASPTRKIIDNGGSGTYKAEAIAEPTLQGYVMYRPADIPSAVTREGALPLLVFANGA